jgi:hypothetical protein
MEDHTDSARVRPGAHPRGSGCVDTYQRHDVAGAVPPDVYNASTSGLILLLELRLHVRQLEAQGLATTRTEYSSNSVRASTAALSSRLASSDDVGVADLIRAFVSSIGLRAAPDWTLPTPSMTGALVLRGGYV